MIYAGSCACAMCIVHSHNIEILLRVSPNQQSRTDFFHYMIVREPIDIQKPKILQNYLVTINCAQILSGEQNCNR